MLGRWLAMKVRGKKWANLLTWPNARAPKKIVLGVGLEENQKR